MIRKNIKIIVLLIFICFSSIANAQVSAYSSSNNYDVDVSFGSVGYTGNAMRILQQRHDNNFSKITHIVGTIGNIVNKVGVRYSENNINYSERQVRYYNNYISYIDSVNRNADLSDNNQANQVIRDLQEMKREFESWLSVPSQTKSATKTSTITTEKRVLFSAMDLYKYKPVNKLKGFNNEQIKSFINNGIDDGMWKQLLINAWSECKKSNTNEVYDMYTFYYGEISKSGFDLYCKELLILMQMDGVIKIN